MHWIRRHRRGRPPHPDVLTPTEWRVLDHIRDGRTNAEIALRMGVTPNTVRTHLTSIYAKTGVTSRPALADWQGRPAEASRPQLGRGVAWPLAGWFTKGTATTAVTVSAGGALSVVFVVSVFAVYAFFAEASDDALHGVRTNQTSAASDLPPFAMLLRETVDGHTSTWFFEFRDYGGWEYSLLDDHGEIRRTETPQPLEAGARSVPTHWFMSADQHLGRAQAAAHGPPLNHDFDADPAGTRVTTWYDRPCESIVDDNARAQLCPEGGSIVETEEYRFDPDSGVPIYYGQSLGDKLVYAIEAQWLIVKPTEVGHVDGFPVGAVRTFEVADGGLTERTGERDWHGAPEAPGLHVARLGSGELRAYDWRDPRTGCGLRWWPDSEIEPAAQEVFAPAGEGAFRDPCHGSAYTVDGERSFGPTPRNLRQYPLKIAPGGRVLVDLSSHGEFEPLIAAPTATPAATPPATATPVAGHAPGVRTGEPSVDAVIDAVLAGETEALLDLARYAEIPCVTSASGDHATEPLCPAGVAQGTPLPAMVNIGCHALLRTPDDLHFDVSTIDSQELQLYLVSEGSDAMLGAEHFRSEYFALFTLEVDSRVTWAWGLHIGQGGFVSIASGCGHSLDDFQTVFGVDAPYLLGPPA